MNRIMALLAACVLCAASSASALYSVSNEGTWPRSWPKELEPLRKQARTLVGPMAPQAHYDIPFATREEFESAWPHLLTVKSPKGPLILVRSPNEWMGKTINAGVRIHCPPAGSDKSAYAERPIPGQTNPRSTWANTSYIELIVDGSIVDLNRIPLPPDTLIIDERALGAGKPGGPSPRE